MRSEEKRRPTSPSFLLTPHSSLLTPHWGWTMTVKRLLLAAAVLAGLASAAWWSRQADWAGTANALEDPAQTTGLKMTAAGVKFVALLTDEQKAAGPVRLRRQGTHRLELRAAAKRQEAAPQRAADGRHDRRGEGGGEGPAQDRRQRRRLHQGRHHHEPGKHPARPGKQRRQRPQPGVVLRQRLRHAVQSRQVGLAHRGPSPVAELHAGRTAR